MKITKIIEKSSKKGFNLLQQMQTTCQLPSVGNIIVVEEKCYKINKIIKDFNATFLIVSPSFDKTPIDIFRKM